MRKATLSLGMAVFLCLTITLIVGYGVAYASSGYLSQFNTRYNTSGTALNTCSVCHTTTPSRNSYGSAFGSNNRNFAAIEPLDSDGDGFTNIVEINARTFPGNSASKPVSTDTSLPTVSAFSIPSTSTSLTVAISSFTASDNVGVTGYTVNESSAKPAASAAGWSASRPASYTFASAGAKTLYAWAKDAAGNVSASRSASVTITLPPTADTSAPAVTAFSIPATASSLTVAISAISASDNVGVTGYIVNESSAKPSASAAGWSASAPTGYTFASAGAKTLYAWARDAAGNVSAGRSASVTITTSTPPPTGNHSSQAWTGTQQCQQCHTQQANEVHGSVHYQWQGQAPYGISGPAVQGKLNTAINSYCVNILGNWNVCGNCHAGLGAKPEAGASAVQFANIDCLVCHQKDYKKKKVNGVFVPDTANMTITMNQAVQTVHKPVRANCLQCHAKAGGGDNNKRGDIALAHANTNDKNFDVHMATTGGNLSCQSCHTTQNHKIAGRGSDLRETDLDVAVACTNCHTNKLSASGHATADVNRHVKKVACQTCHIKAYARDASDTAANESTEIYRDWTKPEWSAASNRYEPVITRGSDLKPAYAFWNGYSYNHNMHETAVIDPATGRYPTSRPEGGINDANSKLFPFKYKAALQPMATNLRKLIALDTGIFMANGDINAAVKQGLTNMGLNSSEPYSFVETDTYQLITHEGMPSSQAVSCNQCHGSTATQMNLKDMGYISKGAASAICAQCHEYKSNPGFTSLHKKHVTEKKVDCSNCHNFTRASSPTPPPSPTNYTLSVTKSGTGSGTVNSSPAGINCGSDCSQSFSANTQVTLSATASSGSTFAGWSGNSDCSDGAVTMNAAKSCTATFNVQQSNLGPDISAPSSFNFGSVNVGSSSTRSISIQNSGTATLRVSRVIVSGANASMFRSLSSSFSVSRSGSYNLRVRFSPRSPGSKTATLTIYSNDPDTPVKSIALSGSGSSNDDD